MLTNYQLKTILEKFTYSSSPYYLALSTTEPAVGGLDGSAVNFTEPSGMGYKRVSLYSRDTTRMTSVQLDESGNVYIINDSEIHFDEATGNWGEISWFGLYSSETGGNLMYFGHILDQSGAESSIHPQENQVAVIRKNCLKIAIKSVEE